MQTPDDKLDLDSISFDDMLGEGLASLPDIEDTEVEEQKDELEEELEEEDIQEDDEELEEEDNEEEVDEEEPEDRESEGSVAFEIAKTLGFELEGEYDDTVEGLTEFAKDIANNIAEEQLEGLFTKYPEVQKHLDYVQSGGDSGKFFEAHNPNTDYNNFNLKEKDTGSQQAILSQYFELKGHDKEFIQEMLEDYEDSGKMFDKAQLAKDALAQAQVQGRENMLETQKAQQEKAEQETTQFWDGVADVIESGKEFAGVSIPDRQKAKFFDYISDPVGENGETQRDIDYTEAEMEVKLAIDYLMYSGFNLEDIIDTKARTKSARSLKGRIQSNEERVKSAKKASRQTKDFDSDNLDMTALF